MVFTLFVHIMNKLGWSFKASKIIFWSGLAVRTRKHDHAPDRLLVESCECSDAEERERRAETLLELLGGLHGDLVVGLGVVDGEVGEVLPQVGQHGRLLRFRSHFQEVRWVVLRSKYV